MKRYFKLLSVFTVIAMCFQFSANALDTSITELSNEIATLESLPEDTSLRTEISKHFKISENGYIAAVYDQPIHYLDDNGVWQDIDNSLVAVNVPSNKLNKTTNGSIDKNINAGEIKYLENKTNPFKVRLPDKLNNNNPIMVSYEGFTLGFKMPEINSQSSANIAKVDLLAKKQVKEKIANTNDPEARLELLRDDAVNIINHISDVSYDDITSNTEATYQISGKQLNQSLIFNSKPTKESYSYELFYDGLVPIIQDTEAVYFYNQSELDNEPVFILDAPYVYDAMDNICSNNTVTINTTETGCQYTFTPNNNWMNSPDATYPITIQSKITTPTDSASIQDNGVNEYNPNDNYYTTDRMYVGSNYANNKGYESRIYIRFPRIASIPTSAYIYKADMILDHHSTASWQSAQANRVDVYEVGNYNWDSKKITWNSQKDYKFTNYITNQTTDKKNTHERYDITTLVRKWYSTTASNNGLVLKPYKVDSTKTNRVCYYSSDCSASLKGYRPRIEIEYYTGSAPVGIEKNGLYYIKNIYSGLYIDVTNNGGVNTNLIQYSFNGGENQLFQLKYISADIFSFIPQHNKSLRIDVPNAGNSDGLNLQVYSSINSKAQLFHIKRNSDATYRIMPLCAETRCLDIEGPSKNNSAPVQIWTWNSNASQMKWVFEKRQYGNGGTYRYAGPGVPPNCFGYAVFRNENITLKLSGSSHYSEDNKGAFEAQLRSRNISFRKISHYLSPINSDEYRIAVRIPNGHVYGGIGYNFHVIYQLSDGTWAGKDHTDPSQHFGNSNPSNMPAMWGGDNYYPQKYGTLYYAIKR